MSILTKVLLASALASVSGCVIALPQSVTTAGGRLGAPRPANVSVADKAVNPIIQALSSYPTSVARQGDVITFTVVTHSPDGSVLDYTWTASKGTLSATKGQMVSWTPQKSDGTLEAGLATVQVLVTNASGGSAASSVNIQVAPDGSAVAGPGASVPVTGAAPVVQEPRPTTSPSSAAPPVVEPKPASALLPLATVEPGIAFNDFYFVSHAAGWVVGGQGAVRRTTDSGVTWSKQVAGNRDLTAIHFVSTSTGWVGGKGGALHKTIDGGQTWAQLDLGTQANVTGVYFVDGDRGYVVTDSTPGLPETDGGLFVTSDGGQTWTNAVKGQFKWLTGTVSGVVFTSDILDGMQRFKDGGMSDTVPLASSYAHVAASPASPSTMLAGNMGGSNFGAKDLYSSADSGGTWVKVDYRLKDDTGIIKDANNAGWAGLSLMSDSEGLGILGRVVVETTDGGRTWTALARADSFPSVTIPRFFASSRKQGWAAHSPTQLLRIGSL